EVQQSPVLHVQARGRRRPDDTRGPLPRMPHDVGRRTRHPSEVTKAYRLRWALFALHTVLFPEATLALQIFEPRYREMIGRCLAHDEPFGVVLILDGEEVGGPAVPRKVGTEASIIASERSKDGQYDIVVEGRRRFRIRS